MMTIFLCRYCKLEIRKVIFVLLIYTVIPIYILYFTFSVDILLYQIAGLLSSYIYALCDKKIKKYK